MTAITETNLKHFAPRIVHTILEAMLVENADTLLVSGGITTAQRLQHFLGQCYVESGGFTTLSENLNYSASRLREVWPSKFKSISMAQSYANNPMKLANYVYGGRLGNTQPGDGWKYRGGGILQMTGRFNYSNIARKTGIDLVNHPDLARDPATALQVAALMWKALGCNEAADDDDVERVTRLVNGGTNGLADREDETDRANAIFLVAPVPSHVKIGLLDAAPEPEESPAAIDSDSQGTPLEAATPEKSVPEQVPMTTVQAKELQQKLKDKGFNPGDVDGNIRSSMTVGAICTLQTQEGLPVTGIVDDATEDAIQNATCKVVSAERANETEHTLRAKGSVTIAAADSSKEAANGVAASGVGAIAIGGGSILSAINDQADQIKEVTDHIPGLSDRLATFLTDHWQLFILLIVGALLFYFEKRIRANAQTVISERVRKSRNGEDMSH